MVKWKKIKYYIYYKIQVTKQRRNYKLKVVILILRLIF